MQQQQSRSTPRGRSEYQSSRGNQQFGGSNHQDQPSSNLSNSSGSSYNNPSSNRAFNTSQPNRKNYNDQFDAVDLSLQNQGYGRRGSKDKPVGDNQRSPLFPLPLAFCPPGLPLQGQSIPNSSVGSSSRTDQHTQKMVYYPTNNNYNGNEEPVHRVLKQSVYDSYRSPVAGLTASPSSQNSQPQNTSSELQSRSFPCRPPVQQQQPTQALQQNFVESQAPRSNMSVLTKMSPDDLLRNFRSLECSGCQRHFGYQSRTNKDLIFCAASCIDDHSGCTSAMVPPVVAKQPAPPPTVPSSSLFDLPQSGGRVGILQQPGGYGPIPLEVMNVNMGGTIERHEVETVRSGTQLQYPSRDQQNKDRSNESGGGRSNFNSSRGSSERSNRDYLGGGYNNRSLGDREQNGYGNNGGRGGFGGGSRNSGGNEQRGSRGGGDNRGYGDRYTGSGSGSYGRKVSDAPNPFTKYGDDDTEWVGSTDVVDRKVKTAEEVRGGKTSTEGAQNKESPSLKSSSLNSSKPVLSTKTTGTTEPPTKGTFTTHQKTPAGPVDVQTGIPAPEDQIVPIKITPVSILSNLGSALKWTPLKLGVPTVVNRSYENDVGDFFIQGFEVNKASLEMIYQINTMVKSGTCVKLSRVEPFTLCLAPYCGEYYRGEVIGAVTSEDTARIFFSDYGNVHDVDRNDIMELPVEFAETPRLTIHCRWDLALAKELSEVKLRKIFSDDRLAVTPKYKVADGQYIVQLGEYSCNAEFNVVTGDSNAEVAQNVRSVTLPMIPQTSVTLESQKPTPPASTPVTQLKRAAVEPTCSTPVVQASPVPTVVTPSAAATPVATPSKASPVPAPVTPSAKASPAVSTHVVAASPVPTVVTPPVEASPVPTVVAPAATTPGRFVGTRPPVMKVQVVTTEPKIPSRKKYMLKDLSYSNCLKPNAEVYVGFQWSLNRFLVVGDDQELEGVKLQMIIQNEIGSCDLLNGDIPVVGEVLLAPYQTGETFRGVVISVDTTTKTAVLEFIDYGDKANCTFENLRVPKAAMMKVPMLGLSVILVELAPSSDREVPSGNLESYSSEKMQLQFLDAQEEEFVIQQDMDVALWISSNLAFNEVVHKKGIPSA